MKVKLLILGLNNGVLWLKWGFWVIFWKVCFSWSRHTFYYQAQSNFSILNCSISRGQGRFLWSLFEDHRTLLFSISRSLIFILVRFLMIAATVSDLGMLLNIKVSLFMKIKLIFNFLIAGTFIDRSALFYFFAKVYFYLFHTLFEDKVKF